jgi:hypothetical protein
VRRLAINQIKGLGEFKSYRTTGETRPIGQSITMSGATAQSMFKSEQYMTSR